MEKPKREQVRRPFFIPISPFTRTQTEETNVKYTKYIIIVAMIATVMVLAGCGARPDPTPTPEPAEQVALAEQRIDLIGTSWELEYFGEAEESLPVLPDTKLTLNMAIRIAWCRTRLPSTLSSRTAR